MREPQIIENVYAYSPWSGELKEYHGDLKHYFPEPSPWNSQLIIGQERTVFISDDGKALQTSPIDGELYNNVLWLREADIAKAAHIFADYEQERLAKLQRQVDTISTRLAMYKSFYEVKGETK